MYACMYGCMYACMYVSMYIRIRVYTYIYTPMYILGVIGDLYEIALGNTSIDFTEFSPWLVLCCERQCLVGTLNTETCDQNLGKENPKKRKGPNEGPLWQAMQKFIKFLGS